MRRLAIVIAIAWVAGCGPKPIYHGADGVARDSTASAPTAPTPDEARVQTVAKPWLNTPYRYGGVDRHGLDCSALAQHIIGDLGITLPRTVKEQRKVGQTVTPSQIRAGDLLFFRLGSSRTNHVGVALDRNRFVHASTSRGVVIDLLMDGYFARNFAEARRVLGTR